MNNNQSSALLKKLIEKTKDNSIYWKRFSSSHVTLKPLPESPTSTTSIVQANSQINLNTTHSYVFSYENGVFALLFYRVLTNEEIHLIVQTNDSPNSLLCAATTSNDVDEISQLKRLYNLVDSSYLTFELDNFIDDFLKNA